MFDWFFGPLSLLFAPIARWWDTLMSTSDGREQLMVIALWVIAGVLVLGLARRIVNNMWRDVKRFAAWRRKQRMLSIDSSHFGSRTRINSFGGIGFGQRIKSEADKTPYEIAMERGANANPEGYANAIRSGLERG